jgi:hypothetical protein
VSGTLQGTTSRLDQVAVDMFVVIADTEIEELDFVVAFAVLLQIVQAGS